MWNHRSHTIFWVCVLTAGTLLGQMTMYVLQVLFRWNLPMNIFDICHSFLGSLGFHFLAIYWDGLVISTFAVSLWLTGRQGILFFQAQRKVERLTNPGATWRLDCQFAGGRDTIVVVEHEQPIALTMGFLRPKIVLSTGLIRMLDEDELEAVIRHEEYHLLHLDPLKTLMTYLASTILWYVPILKWCHNVYKISCEVWADRYAIERTGSAHGLGGALLKLVKAKTVNIPFAHASFSDTSMNVRIRQLVDPEASVPVRMPWRAALVSLHVIVLITGLLLPSPL